MWAGILYRRPENSRSSGEEERLRPSRPQMSDVFQLHPSGLCFYLLPATKRWFFAARRKYLVIWLAQLLWAARVPDARSQEDNQLLLRGEVLSFAKEPADPG